MDGSRIFQDVKEFTMSSISGIDGGSSLALYFQNLSATSNTSATDATTATSPTTTTSSTSNTDASPAIQGGHHHHHGHADAAKSEFFQQLQTAVTGALQSAQQGGTDPNKAIQDAISQIFNNNNSSATSQTSAPANQPATTNDSNDGPPASAGDPPGSATSSLQAFFNTLQSYGIDPQQFHQDFLAAATNAQNGAVNTSTAFQSIPPGTLIDAIG
jgi:hypothetical protein